jgi:hypothetical protein
MDLHGKEVLPPYSLMPFDLKVVMSGKEPEINF